MLGSHSDDRLRRHWLAGAFPVLLSLALGVAPTTAQPGDVEAVSQSAQPRRGDVGRLIDDTALVGAEGRPGDWLSYGRTYKEQRFSPLDQIHAGNVAELGIDWVYDLKADRGIEATPIVVDGVIYATSAWSTVHAVDAATGEPVWDFDPQVDRQSAINLCCGIVNRGVALHEGRVFVGTLDGRLVAVDAATGKVAWDVVTVDQSKPYSITGAPRVVKGKVVIGNGGAEFGVRGYVSAYDSATGELAWRFHTVPGNPDEGFENEAMEMAAETWNGTWWDYGGGGTVWDAIVYDPELDLLYIGVGNGSPWNRELRSPGGGDNLFLSSIVALRPDTGEYVWHYQTTPGDTWDFTATQPIMLADLAIDGRVRKVLMQAPKNGFFYVLDRRAGELISAEKYVPITWASHVDLETGRPVERPGQRYLEKPTVVAPSAFGGHNWHPMSYSPETGLVYLPAHETSTVYAQPPPGQDLEHGLWKTGTARELPDSLRAQVSWPRAYLLAWDPVAQKERWRHEYSQMPGGGTLATAGGLVFQGSPEGTFNAFDATSGKRLWSVWVGAIAAAPVTFSIGETQYVAVVSGVPERSDDEVPTRARLFAFRLGGRGPAIERATRPPSRPRLTQVPSEASAEQIRAGRTTFNYYCRTCHGREAGGGIKDLRYSVPRIYDFYRQILLEGARVDRGMPSFASHLNEEQVDNLRAYVLDRREAARRATGGGR